jgi:hypothetical protein
MEMTIIVVVLVVLVLSGLLGFGVEPVHRLEACSTI